MNPASLTEIAGLFATIGQSCDGSGATVLLVAESDLAMIVIRAILHRDDAGPNEIILPLHRERSGANVVVGFLLASDTNIKLLTAGGRRKQSMHVNPRDSTPVLAAALFSNGVLALWLRRIENHIMIYSFTTASVVNPVCNETRWCSVPFEQILESDIAGDCLKVRYGTTILILEFRNREYEIRDATDADLLPDRSFWRS